MPIDAFHLGWSVVCDGVSSSGLWSSKEQAMHVNWLELSAVLFGVKCFVHSHNCLVKAFCDNSTAVTYINNLGGMVPSLHAVSKSIWEWCFAHHCVLETFHIQAVQIYKLINFLGSIIETLIGNFIQPRSSGFQIHCLFQI